MTIVTFTNGIQYSDRGETSRDMQGDGHRLWLLAALADLVQEANRAVAASVLAQAAGQGRLAFRNAGINGCMRLWSRNITFSPGAGTTRNADNFIYVVNGTPGTTTIERITLASLGLGLDADLLNAWGLRFARRTVVTGSPSGVTARVHQMAIEGVRHFSGLPVTFSAWAWANSGSPTITLQAERRFGAGGSSTQSLASSSAIALSAGATRHALSWTMPQVTNAQTIGSGGDDFILLSLFMPNNATFDMIDVGWEFAVGTGPGSWEHRPLPVEQDLAARYYQRIQTAPLRAYGVAGTPISAPLLLPTRMRAAPSVTVAAAPTLTNCASFTAAAAGAGSVFYGANVTATGNAEIGNTGLLDLSAELI